MADAGWTGRVIDGRYVVEAVLGAGGMGMVLRARHQFTGATVALKVLRPELEVDPDIQVRFLAEARAASAIGHPAIVQVLDAGKDPGGPLYMVMELLVGRPLRISMARSELTQVDVRRIMLELCDVLGAAHARGFVHRDLKPENVFLVAPTGTVKLLDFGIAKVLDGAGARVRTATGALLGTPAYMAPEQLHDPSRVDARADLWAAGVMLFEMLTGRLPFAADSTAALLAALANAEPDSIRRYLPHASPALEQLFARALARDPQRRCSTAAELAQVIGRVDFGQPLASTPGNAATMMTGAAAVGPTQATGAPLGHVASMPVPGASTPAPSPTPAARPPGLDRTRWILGALGLLAVIVAVSIAIGAARTPAPAKEPDPGPRKIGSDQWGTQTEPAISPAIQRNLDQQACTAACDAATRCGTNLTSCVSDCMTNPVARRCIELSRDDCAAGAQCGFTALCSGRGPTGTKTCRQTIACVQQCSFDLGCHCRCYASMAPASALETGRVTACIARCNLEPNCIKRTCQAAGAGCH